MRSSLLLTRTALFESPQRLPIGFFLKGKRIESFRLQPYTSEHDLQILRLRRRGEDDLLNLCFQLFPTILADFGGIHVSDLTQRMGIDLEDFIAEIPVADALTIVSNIRYLELGEEMYFKGTCPYCGANNDDDPKKGLSHKLGGIDMVFCQDLSADPLVSVLLSTGVAIDIYPLQLYQFKDFCRSTAPPDLRQAFYSIVSSSDGLFDRSRDGLISEQVFLQLITNIEDRNLILKSVAPFYQLGPQIEIGTDCVKCKQEWEMDLPTSSLEDFFCNIFLTPTEEDLENIFFYMSFGEQAPCKSIQEAKQMPVRERDRLVAKIAESYKRQQDDAKKGSKGGKNTTTEYA